MEAVLPPERSDDRSVGASGPYADQDLYRRSTGTLLASWREYACGSADAALLRAEGVTAAVFPTEPERSVYNNALVDRNLTADESARAIAALRSSYAEAGVDRYAAWVHDSDEVTRAEFERHDHRIVEATRVMAIALPRLAEAPCEVEIESLAWPRYLEFLDRDEAPAGLLRGVDPAAFHALGVRVDREDVAAAIALDHEGDCGIYNMSTLEPYRRRGLGTALLVRHLEDAVARSCSSATLQSTPIAEGVYRSAGFGSLGRYLEYVPAAFV
jgi:GNAT superfamily N-acetyltransferase